MFDFNSYTFHSSAVHQQSAKYEITKFRKPSDDSYEIQKKIGSTVDDRPNETSNVPFLSLSGRCRITCKCSSICWFFIANHQLENQVIYFKNMLKCVEESCINSPIYLYLGYFHIFHNNFDIFVCWKFDSLAYIQNRFTVQITPMC